MTPLAIPAIILAVGVPATHAARLTYWHAYRRERGEPRPTWRECVAPTISGAWWSLLTVMLLDALR